MKKRAKRTNAINREEIKISFTQAGKKIGALSLLLTFASGLGAYGNGAYREYNQGETVKLSRNNEKNLISVTDKSKENESNIKRIYQKLDSLDVGQRQIILLLRR